MIHIKKIGKIVEITINCVSIRKCFCSNIVRKLIKVTSFKNVNTAMEPEAASRDKGPAAK